MFSFLVSSNVFRSYYTIIRSSVLWWTHTRGPGPEEFTRRDWSQSLVPRTVHTKRFQEEVTGTCPKNSNQFEFLGLVAGTKLWSLWLDFEAEEDGTCPCDLLQWLVAGTSPLECADLSELTDNCLQSENISPEGGGGNSVNSVITIQSWRWPGKDKHQNGYLPQYIYLNIVV